MAEIQQPKKSRQTESVCSLWGGGGGIVILHHHDSPQLMTWFQNTEPLYGVTGVTVLCGCEERQGREIVQVTIWRGVLLCCVVLCCVTVYSNSLERHYRVTVQSDSTE